MTRWYTAVRLLQPKASSLVASRRLAPVPGRSASSSSLQPRPLIRNETAVRVCRSIEPTACRIVVREQNRCRGIWPREWGSGRRLRGADGHVSRSRSTRMSITENSEQEDIHRRSEVDLSLSRLLRRVPGSNSDHMVSGAHNRLSPVPRHDHPGEDAVHRAGHPGRVVVPARHTGEPPVEDAHRGHCTGCSYIAVLWGAAIPAGCEPARAGLGGGTWGVKARNRWPIFGQPHWPSSSASYN
jgi:hypothetical protein